MRAPVARHARDVPAEERDGAGVGRELTGDEVEERRLARAVRPDDQTALARLDGEVDGVRHTEAAERLLELLHGERSHRRRSGLSCVASSVSTRRTACTWTEPRRSTFTGRAPSPTIPSSS